MLHLYDRAGFARALTLDLGPNLHRLLADRIGALTEDLIDYTEYLVVQPGDTEAGIIRHIGLSPLVEPIEGIRFGEPGFRPHWDWLEKHRDCFELIFTFGSSFAYIVIVEDREGVPRELLTLCRAYNDRRSQNP